MRPFIDQVDERADDWRGVIAPPCHGEIDHGLPLLDCSIFDIGNLQFSRDRRHDGYADAGSNQSYDGFERRHLLDNLWYGENITFGPGDLVLTPHDTWHNHGNGPVEASVNLSVLDMPLVNILSATYFEFDYMEKEGDELVSKKVQSASVPDDYSQRMYGTGGLVPRFINHHRGAGTSSPMFVYRWEETEKLLRKLRDQEGSPYDGILVEYTNPVTGKPVYKTMTFFIQMLRPNEKLLPVRQNASQICTVFSGRGHSVIGGKRFDWEPFDTFCVPGGEWYEHVSDSPKEDATFLVSSDEPTLRKLGFAMKHGRRASGETVLLDTSKHFEG